MCADEVRARSRSFTRNFRVSGLLELLQRDELASRLLLKQAFQTGIVQLSVREHCFANQVEGLVEADPHPACVEEQLHSDGGLARGKAGRLL